ncbi:MAG: hypothetical protein QG622_642 [Actinomycetota bacterium]|nr:hypothetical protein [Actinomycetota bacterium]
MIIRSGDVVMRSAHVHERRTTSETTVRSWTGAAPAGQVPGATRPGGTPGRPSGTVPDDASRTSAGASPTSSTAGLSSRFASLIALVERLTGERIHVMDASELGSGPGAGPSGDPGEHRVPGVLPVPRTGAAPSGTTGRSGAGMEILTTATDVEVEATAVGIAASVTTTDGRRIDAAVDLQLYRERARSSRTRLTVGAPEVKDPLALSFGVLPGLRDERVELDLDGDGTTESLPFVAEGLAYLALDRDGDGTVSSGAELFGPRSGNGFSELAAFDSDGNGWIDEADPVFGQLRLWGGPDDALETLAERGVGAIGLANVASPFTLRSGDTLATGDTSATGSDVLGELRSTGLWLGEDGSAGTVHQVDVVS